MILGQLTLTREEIARFRELLSRADGLVNEARSSSSEMRGVVLVPKRELVGHKEKGDEDTDRGSEG